MDTALDQTERILTTALANLDASQTQLRPLAHPDKWCIQQVIEHLNLTYASTLHTVEHRLARGTPTLARPTLRDRCLQIMVLNIGYLPQGRPAPASVVPSPALPPLSGQQLAAEIQAHLDSLSRALSQAEALFGDRRSITHQVLGPLSLAQWSKFHLVHGRHHAKQILAVRRDHHI